MGWLNERRRAFSVAGEALLVMTCHVFVVGDEVFKGAVTLSGRTAARIACDVKPSKISVLKLRLPPAWNCVTATVITGTSAVIKASTSPRQARA
jgi:hypothetical protein